MNSTNHAAPGWKCAVMLLWFPCFFAAGFAVLGLFAFSHPTPHDVEVGVFAPAARLDFSKLPDGVDLIDVDDAARAQTLVASGELAAATDGIELFVASAASSTRAGYIEDAFAEALANDLAVIDVNPLPEGDVSGVGLFFYALPNLLVGLVTSIALLQSGVSSVGRRALAIFATGSFSAVFSYALASGMAVIPPDERLIVHALLLTQAIGWLTTAAALYAKRFFMPLAMTFVLILGIPSSGGTVSIDMLPSWVRWIGDWHPFAQFIELARADVYLGTDGARPLSVIGAWAALGAALLLARAFRDSRRAHVRIAPLAPAQG